MALQPEQIDHINIVNWFHHTFPELADDFHHFANERKCSIAQGQLLKRMGVKKGVADFFLAFPVQYKAGLWLELKVGKNKLTKEQEAFLLRKSERGYEAKVVWGFDKAKEVIMHYLVGYISVRAQNIPKNLYYYKPIC
jgi:hypothetical protein